MSGQQFPAPLLEEWDADVVSTDPLGFPGYASRLTAAGAAVRTGRSEHYALVESDFDVIAGTMGAAVGERIVRAYKRAADLDIPIVVVTRSGGARVQEGMFALVQLARTAEAAVHHRRHGRLSLVVHRSPTVGGVLASYGSLGHLSAAERGGVLGLAGPRVVAQTQGRPVSAGSHLAETALRHARVDAVLDPPELGEWVDRALGLVDRPLPTRPLPAWSDEGGTGAWAAVGRSRVIGRPTGIDRAARLCTSWTEIAGTDSTLRAGLGTIDGTRCVVVASDRYADDGRPTPAAYRMVRRSITIATELGLPWLSLVDMPGADASPAANTGGIAREIAETFAALVTADVPTVSVCVGEGGSGGALALAHTDRFLIQEHGVFSVIDPEGAAAILERDASKAPEIAEHLALTAPDLLAHGIVDEVVPEGQEALAVAVAKALADAVVGDRQRRVDAVTRLALETD